MLVLQGLFVVPIEIGYKGIINCPLKAFCELELPRFYSIQEGISSHFFLISTHSFYSAL